MTSYGVYRFEGKTVPEGYDLANAAPLVATVRGTTYTDPTAEPGKRYTYMVSALDRLWHESAGSAPLDLNGRASVCIRLK